MREAVTRSVPAACLAVYHPGARASTWHGRQGLAAGARPDEEALCARRSCSRGQAGTPQPSPHHGKAVCAAGQSPGGVIYGSPQAVLPNTPACPPAEELAERGPGKGEGSEQLGSSQTRKVPKRLVLGARHL